MVYDHHGNATVSIRTKNGEVRRIKIDNRGGAAYTCPADVHDDLKQEDITLGRIKLTLLDVRHQESKIMRQYPNEAPLAVQERFVALNDRDSRLVRAYNAEVRQRNNEMKLFCRPGN